ncbi:MAG: LytTR family transcriptional regulator DNA-binding domain-containing protein [Bacteroidales bacterium]
MKPVLTSSICDKCVYKTTSCLFIKINDYSRKIKFEDIIYLQAAGSYSDIYLKGGNKLTLSYNLSELEAHFHSPYFLRTHRSYMINQEYITKFIGNTLYLGTIQIPISKSHKESVFEALNILQSKKVKIPR